MDSLRAGLYHDSRNSRSGSYGQPTGSSSAATILTALRARRASRRHRSLSLDRAGNPSAAVQVCEIGLVRFSHEARRYKLVEQIEKRAERCRAKARLAKNR
jgi:hypothetical protein